MINYFRRQKPENESVKTARQEICETLLYGLKISLKNAEEINATKGRLEQLSENPETNNNNIQIEQERLKLLENRADEIKQKSRKDIEQNFVGINFNSGSK